MPRKPIDLPPAVARRFVEDMCAFFAEPKTIQADAIAARHFMPCKNTMSANFA
jgi:hypothetical protein